MDLNTWLFMQTSLMWRLIFGHTDACPIRTDQARYPARAGCDQTPSARQLQSSMLSAAAAAPCPTPPASQHRNEGIYPFVLKCQFTEMRSALTFHRVQWRSGTPDLSLLTGNSCSNRAKRLAPYLSWNWTDCSRNTWIITLRTRRNLTWCTRRMRKCTLWNYKGGRKCHVS